MDPIGFRFRRLPSERRQFQGSKKAAYRHWNETYNDPSLDSNELGRRQMDHIGLCFEESLGGVKHGKEPLSYKVEGTNISNVIYTSNRNDIVTLISLRNL